MTTEALEVSVPFRGSRSEMVLWGVALVALSYIVSVPFRGSRSEMSWGGLRTSFRPLSGFTF